MVRPLLWMRVFPVTATLPSTKGSKAQHEVNAGLRLTSKSRPTLASASKPVMVASLAFITISKSLTSTRSSFSKPETLSSKSLLVIEKNVSTLSSDPKPETLVIWELSLKVIDSARVIDPKPEKDGTLLPLREKRPISPVSEEKEGKVASMVLPPKLKNPPRLVSFSKPEMVVSTTLLKISI